MQVNATFDVADSTAAASTSVNLTFLQRNLLDDTATAIWSTTELYDAMETETYFFDGHLSPVSTLVMESGRPFWVPYGTSDGEAPVLAVLRNGTVLGTSEYTVDYLNGRVTMATGIGTSGTYITATFYACNLWAVAQQALLRRVNSTAITGEKKSIKLGPLAKSVTGPMEMAQSFGERINMFARFAQQWRVKSSNPMRIRL
jgi:hypothetical protein